MNEIALALSAMTASHHQWPMKPAPEPAPIVQPAPVQTRYIDLRELRKTIDRYCPRAEASEPVYHYHRPRYAPVIISEHISDERLAQYSEGRLVEPQLGEVEEHLLICEQCCARLTKFDDTWGLNG
jgi:hypothetical protein